MDSVMDLRKISRLTFCVMLILWILCYATVDSRAIHKKTLALHKRSPGYATVNARHRVKRPSIAGLDNIDFAISTLERARSRNRGNRLVMGSLTISDLANLLQAG